MKFYYDIFKEVRQKKKISVVFVSKNTGIDRGTLWSWEKGKTSPNENKVRKLAEILKIPVTEISDLEIEHPLSEGKISELANSWQIFSEKENTSQEALQQILLNNLGDLFKKFNQTSIIIKAIMSSMNFMFYVKDTNLKYITANKSFLENTSSSIAEHQVLGCKDSNFFSLQEARENEIQDEKVIFKGKPLVDFEGKIPGTRRKKWGLISKYPILDSEGKVGGVIGAFVDITERKRNEEIREMLDLSLNSVSDAYCIREINKNSYFFVSKVIDNIMGITAKEYMKGGVDFWLKNCVHPNDREEQTKYYKNKSWPERREYRIIKANGEIRLIEATCDFQHFLGKEFMCSVIRDITEKRESEEVSELLRLNVDAMESVITLSSYDKKHSKDITKYTNESTKKMFGFSTEEFYKSGIEVWLNCLHPKDKEREVEYLNKRSWPDKDEYRVIRPTGETRWIEATRRKKNFLGTEYMLTVSRDITERKKKEDSKELLELCLNTISEGFRIGTPSAENDLHFLNDAAVELFGYPKKELCDGGSKFWLNKCVHPEDRQQQIEYLKDKSFPAIRKYRIVRKNGEIRKIRVKYTEKRLVNKRYSIYVYKDITEEY
jgi:PAS domain S-box-containing protein